VPSIGGEDVACAEWSNIRRFEHLLKLRNLVDNAFSVHPSQYLTQNTHFVIHVRFPFRQPSLACVWAKMRPGRNQPVAFCAELTDFTRLDNIEISVMPCACNCRRCDEEKVLCSRRILIDRLRRLLHLCGIPLAEWRVRATQIEPDGGLRQFEGCGATRAAVASAKESFHSGSIPPVLSIANNPEINVGHFLGGGYRIFQTSWSNSSTLRRKPTNFSKQKPRRVVSATRSGPLVNRLIYVAEMKASLSRTETRPPYEHPPQALL
jgi:hypothetical protein